MKRYTLVLIVLFISTIVTQAQSPESLEQFYRNQKINIETSKITYFKIKTIPPLILRGGMKRVEEQNQWLVDQFDMFRKVREAGNYDPVKEKEVLKTIDTFQSGMYEPRVYHQEVTYITTPEKRCQIIKKLSPGEPFEQTKVYDGEKSFLYIPHLDELHTLKNSVWINPKEGMCRFGADIGWWLEHGYTISTKDEYYTLIDSEGDIGSAFLIDPDNHNAWTQLIFAGGRYMINASDFQIEKGLPIPKIVTVHQKLSDGNYYEIDRLELLEAEIDLSIDDSLFQTPETESAENSRSKKRRDL